MRLTAMSLPRDPDRPAYAELRATPGRWLDAVAAIAREHGLPSEIAALGGSNLVASAGDRFIVKLFPPVDRADGRRGQVFPHRYHATQITTPRQARCALAYVLNNWRHHREDLPAEQTRSAAMDPYASGVSFDGWRGRRFRVPARYVPLPVSAPRTALLRSSWTRFGLIDPFECPAPRGRL
jgi:hypothetical protein